jgi:hypothetical protein
LLAVAEAAGFEVIITTESGDSISAKFDSPEDLDHSLVCTNKLACRLAALDSGFH